MSHLRSNITRGTSSSRSPNCSRWTHISFFSRWTNRARGSLIMTCSVLNSVQHGCVLLVLWKFKLEWYLNMLPTLCPLGPMIPIAPSSPGAPWREMIDRWLSEGSYCNVWQVTLLCIIHTELPGSPWSPVKPRWPFWPLSPASPLSPLSPIGPCGPWGWLEEMYAWLINTSCRFPLCYFHKLTCH